MTAAIIQKERMDYDNLWGESYNSNSVIRTLLDQNKVKAILPGISEEKVPGWKNNLFKTKVKK